jgi:GDPmannose 4,6-dehydratase
MRRALVSGITGQIGSYLAELLLSKGYEVHGIIRRSSSFNTGRIDRVFDRLHLHYGDMSDGTGLRRILEKVRPDEVFSLAAQSHVRVSFDQPEYTADVVATGTLRLLEAIRDYGGGVRFFQASSSEMFGSAPPAQNEETPFHPRSPYAVAKIAAHHYCVNYREAYNMFVSCGILFNTESPRRGETFVTRKVTRAAARIKLGLQDTLYLGNLDAKRDWNFAGDTVRAIWLMLQTERPSDYVVATEEAHSVRQLLDEAFGYLGLDWKKHVKTDTRYYRPAEVDHLCGDARKAMRELGWRPTVGFSELVRMMVDHDLDLARKEAG